MNNEKTAIQVLCITAVVLFLACMFVQRPVTAEVTTSGGDYLVATYPSSTGGDAVYVADTRSGMMVAFTYDSGAKQLVPQAVRPIGDAFAGR